MSQVYVDTLKDREGTGSPTFPNGIQVTGVGTFSSQVSIAGTLTYEDVTQVDSVGIVTARLGLRATAGGLQVTAGITTLGGNLTIAGDTSLTDTEGKIEATGSTGLTLNASHGSAYTRIRTAGTERLRVTSAGSVGVGTDDPQELFSVSQGHIFVSNSTAPQIRISPDNSDASDNNRTLLGQATGTNQFVNGSVSGDSVLRGNTTGAFLFGIGTGEKARLTATGGVSLNNGELIERCNISSTALNSDTAINLDNGMVHYRTTAIGAASVKPNIYSSVGINTQMATGDIITVTIITACSSTSNFVDHIMVDYKDVTENWVGGSAPTAGGGSGVDTYAFNIIKTASETFTVIGNHVKTS